MNVTLEEFSRKASQYGVTDPVYQRLIHKSLKKQNVNIELSKTLEDSGDVHFLLTMLAVTNQLIKFENESMFSKYNKMKRFGLSNEVIYHQMKVDGRSHKDINQFFCQIPQATQFLIAKNNNKNKNKNNKNSKQQARYMRKYTKMARVGVPKQCILNAMIINGMDSKFIKQFFNNNNNKTVACISVKPVKSSCDNSTKISKNEQYLQRIKRMKKMAMRRDMDVTVDTSKNCMVSRNNVNERSLWERSNMSQTDVGCVGSQVSMAKPVSVANKRISNDQSGKTYNKHAHNSNYSYNYKSNLNYVNKYSKMKKYGLPNESIYKQMAIDAKQLKNSLKTVKMDVKKWRKYKKMQRANVPHASIRQKMKLDRMNQTFINAFFGQTVSSL